MKSELVVQKVNDKGASVQVRNVRLTFVYLDAPQKDMNGDPDKGKYSVTGIIPARDFPAIRKQFVSVFEQILKVSGKIKDKDLRLKVFKNATADGKKGAFFKIGDEQKDKTGKVRKGLESAYTFTASMDAIRTGEGFRPKFDLILRDKFNQTVPEHAVKGEFYSGCYAHLALTLQPFDYLGNQGIKAYLNGVLKVDDGEKLSGADPFADYVPPTMATDEADVSFGDETPKAKRGKK